MELSLAGTEDTRSFGSTYAAERVIPKSKRMLLEVSTGIAKLGYDQGLSDCCDGSAKREKRSLWSFILLKKATSDGGGLGWMEGGSGARRGKNEGVIMLGCSGTLCMDSSGSTGVRVWEGSGGPGRFRLLGCLMVTSWPVTGSSCRGGYVQLESTRRLSVRYHLDSCGRLTKHYISDR